MVPKRYYYGTMENAIIKSTVPPELKAAFEAACARNDQSAAQVIRAMMREYVRKNAQPDLPIEKGKK